jgi:hypothetical protein
LKPPLVPNGFTVKATEEVADENLAEPSEDTFTEASEETKQPEFEGQALV